ncbi:hypothetical protein KP509_36G045900 [Ceratopteris richardii]|uniref:VQ domain-containing protein n=1 Tax=Ceratopteris richardii TaxID=49495 RepID=A0A8T2QCR1_CERRI|nr:hypothetical protein KP509_36G045900 [Ceratopteris richardii]
MKSTHAVEYIGVGEDVEMSQKTSADGPSPSSSSPSSCLERKRRSPQPSGLIPNKRRRREDRWRQEEAPVADPPVCRRILADKSNFKDIVHQFTGNPTSSTPPLFHRSNEPAASQTSGSTCLCHCHRDGHSSSQDALLSTVYQRLRILEAVTAHLLLRQGCLTTTHGNP